MLMSAIIGHRGARGLAPENTLASIQRAAQLGVRWIEVDVMLTRDQLPILFHDAFLNKLSNGQGLVKEFDFSVLEPLRVLSPVTVPKAESQPIASLAGALSCAQELGLGLNLEIKPSHTKNQRINLQRIASQLEAFPGLPLVLSSFSSEVLKEAQQLLPQIPRACLWEELPDGWQSQVKKLKTHSVHLADFWVKPAQVAALKSYGQEVYVYTVNSRKRADKLFGWGVKGIFTDFPDRFQTHLHQGLQASPFGQPL